MPDDTNHDLPEDPQNDLPTDEKDTPPDDPQEAPTVAFGWIEDDEPPVDDDDTADLLPQDIDAADLDDIDPDGDDIPFNLPVLNTDDGQNTVDRRDNDYAALTRPHFFEPGTTDPKKTLPGTGGLDPNPDMLEQAQPVPDDQRTVQHIPAVNRAATEPRASSRASSAGQQTMPNPNLSDGRYQRPPQQQNRQNAQGRYVPAPPQGQQPNQRNRKQRPPSRILGFRPGCFYMMLGLMLTFCGGITLATLGAAVFVIPQVEAQWTEQIAAVDDYRAFESTFVYDRYGNELFEEFGEGRRDTVPYERFPQDLIDATVSIEDDTFWQNIGVDVGATLVAASQYFGSGNDGGRVPGGSTITQQVVRNILFDFEKRTTVSVARKAEEIVLAVALTSRKAKEDVLALYLNEIYYGNLAYGAQAAAQTFFGKDVENLTLGEAALLAGLPQAPANLNPLNPDPEVQNRVNARWRQVLGEMVEEGYITDAERNTVLREGLTFVEPTASLRAPHFTVYAQDEYKRILEDLGYTPDDIASGGYEVYTTVDQQINQAALNAARDQVSQLQSNNVSNAAVIVQKPLTGEILAMVGSIDYNSDVIDGRVNVTTSLRQPGSTMKPFTYAAAMERGMTPGDVLWDTKTEIGIPGQPTYEPVNYDRRYHGAMNIRAALANSYNIPAVQTLRIIGVEALLELMRRFGVTTFNQDASQYGLSLTLGGGEMSLLELANAYGVFANLGSYVESTSVLCIVGSNDEIIYQYENGCPEGAGRFTNGTLDRPGFGRQVLDPRLAFIITDILSDNAARTPAMGTNSPLNTPNIGSAAKTGTTNDIKDNWTVGYTRNVVVGVWVGNNNGDPMVNSSGLTGAAPIWNAVMTEVYARYLEPFRVGGQLLPDKHNAPQGISLRRICDVQRMSDPATSCPQRDEWLLDGPAGTPDAQGNLSYPPQQPDLTGVDPQDAYVQETSPDVYRALVLPLPPSVAAGIQFQVEPGQEVPPPPKYCRVTQQTAATANGAQEQLFIAGPRIHDDAVEAERYAQSRNVPFLPTVDCWEGVQSAGGGDGWGAPVTTAVINSPANGQTIASNTVTSITGTVQFDSSQADYYHLFLRGGNFQNWTPLGEEHYQSVINGELETLGGLPAGQYQLQLVLVKDGSYVQQPYEVSFTVQ